MKTHIEIPSLNLREDGHDDRYDTAIMEAAEAVGIVDIEEYLSKDGWRWRLKNPGNQKIVDASTQGFHDREESRENFRRIYRAVGGTLAISWQEVED